ncbi:MAG: hypothetical protein AAF739_03180 [Pseudomonadota bacterium]
MSFIPAMVDRLLQPGTPFLAVQGAIDFASIKSHNLGSPSAYLFAKDEASGDNERMTGPVLQRLESDVAVVIVVQNVTDAVMGAAADELEPLKTYVRSKLIGFVPDGLDEPIVHVSGQLITAANSTVYFEDVYGVTSYLQEQSP